MSLIVFCPTRGRAVQAREAYQSFLATKRRTSTVMVFVVDEDDPTEYDVPLIMPAHAGGMGNALNAAFEAMAKHYDVSGFVGDDHRFRTRDWDVAIETLLAEQGGGIAYADDLNQGIKLPTQVFMSTEIPKTLGWMALPGAKHLYLDNAWKDLGEALDKLYYFPQIIIEHMHPTIGKSEWDEGYRRVNAPELYEHDAQVFAAWKATTFAADVEAVRARLA